MCLDTVSVFDRVLYLYLNFIRKPYFPETFTQYTINHVETYDEEFTRAAKGHGTFLMTFLYA